MGMSQFVENTCHYNVHNVHMFTFWLCGLALCPETLLADATSRNRLI
jgi:hypothetical protein